MIVTTAQHRAGVAVGVRHAAARVVRRSRFGRDPRFGNSADVNFENAHDEPPMKGRSKDNLQSLCVNENGVPRRTRTDILQNHNLGLYL